MNCEFINKTTYHDNMIINWIDFVKDNFEDFKKLNIKKIVAIPCRNGNFYINIIDINPDFSCVLLVNKEFASLI